jgi:hypothetical protein
MTPRPLWTCPECAQTFVTRNASHSCVQLTLDGFFGDRRAQRQLYEALLELVRRFGPVTVKVNKSRISFQARVGFATVARVTRSGLVCTFWLKREVVSPRITRVEAVSAEQLRPPVQAHGRERARRRARGLATRCVRGRAADGFVTYRAPSAM